MVTEAEDAGGSVCIVMRSLCNLDKIQAEETVYSKIRRRHNIYIVCVCVSECINVYLVGVHIQYIIYTLLELQRL